MEPDLDDQRPGLSPPKFSLATLLVAVGVLGVLFAATSYFGAYATLLLLLFIMTVAAHVAGNAIGTRLRDNGNQRMIADGDAVGQRRRLVSSTDFAPTSQLHYRSALGKPIFITTVTGCVAGAVLGGYGLAMLMEHRTLQAIALGVVASGVLGGIWTFVASSFLQVATSAWRQATRDTTIKH